MTFWQFLLICFKWIGARATRILGLAQGTLAIVVLQENLFTAKQAGYIMLAIAVLTYWRGQSTAGTVATAAAIVAQVKDNPTIVPIIPKPPSESKI